MFVLAWKDRDKYQYIHFHCNSLGSERGSETIEGATIFEDMEALIKFIHNRGHIGISVANLDNIELVEIELIPNIYREVRRIG